MIKSETNQLREPTHYFVDESGDGVLFDRKGKVLCETGSAPRYFILGMLHIEQPEKVGQSLNKLRATLLADPYFNGVPSFQTPAKKTALHFHAKDDLPEVRREVFKLLMTIEFKFFAVVKHMDVVLDYVRSRNSMDITYHYQPNELYDLTVRMLFKNRLHKHQAYRVVFARRGQRNRTEALREQLLAAREKFLKQFGRESLDTEIKVVPAHPWEAPSLQIVDYCLWALQRLYEKREDRYMQLLWSGNKISLIHDVDNKGRNHYGTYYTKRNPLTAEEIKK
jgi:hypothetical protein